MVDMFVGKVSKLCFEADIAVRVEEVWDMPDLIAEE